MTKFSKTWIFLNEISLKTIYFNFKYLPFKQAIRLPIFISKHVFLLNTNGKIIIQAPLRTRLIRIGYGGIGIFDYKRSRAIWQNEGTVVFKGRTTIGHGCKISVGKTAEIILGEDFIMTAESTLLASQKKIEFGTNCLLSWDTLVMDTDFHKILDKNKELLNPAADIKIGNHVWVGCRCLILKGAQIASNTIIAANSLVNKSLTDENVLYGGQPAKQLKDEVTWKE